METAIFVGAIVSLFGFLLTVIGWLGTSRLGVMVTTLIRVDKSVEAMQVAFSDYKEAVAEKYLPRDEAIDRINRLTDEVRDDFKILHGRIDDLAVQIGNRREGD